MRFNWSALASSRALSRGPLMPIGRSLFFMSVMFLSILFLFLLLQFPALAPGPL